MGDQKNMTIMNRLKSFLKDFLGDNQTSKANNGIDLKICNLIVHQRGNINGCFPSDFSSDEKELIDFAKNYTMTSQERMVTLLRAVEYIVKENVKGDIVECGVWRGGCMMLIASKLKQLNCNNKNLFLCDTFDGMPEPSKNDVNLHGIDASSLLSKEIDKYSGNNIWCYASLGDVKENVSKTKYNPSKIHYLQGKVEQTLPNDLIKEISLLRLDTDWYESTKHELESLYDRLVVGGVLIIDDYGHWGGAKKAVDEFFGNRGIKIFLNRIDYTGRLGIKLI